VPDRSARGEARVGWERRGVGTDPRSPGGAAPTEAIGRGPGLPRNTSARLVATDEASIHEAGVALNHGRSVIQRIEDG